MSNKSYRILRKILHYIKSYENFYIYSPLKVIDDDFLKKSIQIIKNIKIPVLIQDIICYMFLTTLTIFSIQAFERVRGVVYELEIGPYVFVPIDNWLDYVKFIFTLILFALIIVAIKKDKSMLFLLCTIIYLFVIDYGIFSNNFLFFLIPWCVCSVANILIGIIFRKKKYFYLKVFLMLVACCILSVLSVVSCIGITFAGFWFALYILALIWIPAIGYITLCFWRRKKEKIAVQTDENSNYF